MPDDDDRDERMDRAERPEDPLTLLPPRVIASFLYLDWAEEARNPVGYEGEVYTESRPNPRRRLGGAETKTYNASVECIGNFIRGQMKAIPPTPDEAAETAARRAKEAEDDEPKTLTDDDEAEGGS